MEESQLYTNLKAHLEAYEKQRNELKKLKGDDQEPPLRVSYGTAGFRGLASQIEHIFFNVGLISGFKCLISKANIGIMITASHNPIQDNGVKLIESNGEMLSSQWEEIVESFCNTQDKVQLMRQLRELTSKFPSFKEKQSSPPKVLIGMDTRPSSEALLLLVKSGLDAWRPLIECHDYGLVTTPLLHYLVAESNKTSERGTIPVDFYYNQLADSLENLFASNEGPLYSAKQLTVDCANGVGTETMRQLLSRPNFARCLPLKLINTAEDGILNKLCGADYVKTNKLPCKNADSIEQSRSTRFASLDGDADRVVYFYLSLENATSTLRLLDGDKIMALYCLYLKDILHRYSLNEELSLGCVQTAYANGASTDYLSRVLGLKVDCVDTGVKNLHKKALDYDIGVFFEANGHGTIWISPKARSLVNEGERCPELRKLFKIINNYTGDAISDILIVEAILNVYDWDIRKWDELYEDRPNALMKVKIRNREIVKTTNAGRSCLEPAGLQERIDEEVRKLGLGARSFVRPSGTENVVRVYAEAETQELANNLANSICNLVKQLCN